MWTVTQTRATMKLSMMLVFVFFFFFVVVALLLGLSTSTTKAEKLVEGDTTAKPQESNKNAKNKPGPSPEKQYMFLHLLKNKLGYTIVLDSAEKEHKAFLFQGPGEIQLNYCWFTGISCHALPVINLVPAKPQLAICSHINSLRIVDTLIFCNAIDLEVAHTETAAAVEVWKKIDGFEYMATACRASTVFCEAVELRQLNDSFIVISSGNFVFYGMRDLVQWTNFQFHGLQSEATNRGTTYLIHGQVVAHVKGKDRNHFELYIAAGSPSLELQMNEYIRVNGSQIVDVKQNFQSSKKIYLYLDKNGHWGSNVPSSIFSYVHNVSMSTMYQDFTSKDKRFVPNVMIFNFTSLFISKQNQNDFIEWKPVEGLKIIDKISVDINGNEERLELTVKSAADRCPSLTVAGNGKVGNVKNGHFFQYQITLSNIKFEVARCCEKCPAKNNLLFRSGDREPKTIGDSEVRFQVQLTANELKSGEPSRFKKSTKEDSQHGEVDYENQQLTDITESIAVMQDQLNSAIALAIAALLFALLALASSMILFWKVVHRRLSVEPEVYGRKRYR